MTPAQQRLIVKALRAHADSGALDAREADRLADAIQFGGLLDTLYPSRSS